MNIGELIDELENDFVWTPADDDELLETFDCLCLELDDTLPFVYE